MRRLILIVALQRPLRRFALGDVTALRHGTGKAHSLHKTVLSDATAMCCNPIEMSAGKQSRNVRPLPIVPTQWVGTSADRSIDGTRSALSVGQRGQGPAPRSGPPEAAALRSVSNRGTIAGAVSVGPGPDQDRRRGLRPIR